MLARVDTRPRHRNAGRPAEKDAPGYLKWLRGRPCHLAKRGGCEGKVRSAHVDCAGGKGMGTKVADMYAIPLCDFHHGQQHNTGWATFQSIYRFDAVRVASEFWRAWPGRVAWQRVLEVRRQMDAEGRQMRS